MIRRQLSRRDFVKHSATLAAATTAPYWLAGRSWADEIKKDGIKFGAIGVGGQGTHVAEQATKLGELVSICDVDLNNAAKARHKLAHKAEIVDDYRRVLDRQDIEVVTIGTPDHWHTAICLAALAAGKHVFCEKPLTLTIAEGKQLVDAVKKSGKTMQVGTMQRSNLKLFARAVATVRGGYLGKINKVFVRLPLSTLEGGPFEKKEIPDTLNWDMWLGQAPAVDYCPERCHYTFRWWYDYSGGVMTDWGAHHMDITQWGLNCEKSGPLTIDGTATKLPKIPGGYNTPKHPKVLYTYPNDVTVEVTTDKLGPHKEEQEQGIHFQGDKGDLWVDRHGVYGKAIEEHDKDRKLKEKVMQGAKDLFHGNPVTNNHMGNFFTAFREGKPTISDVESQHRSVSACHLANISIRLKRKLTWDPVKEDFVGDAEASAMLSRPQREPYRFS